MHLEKIWGFVATPFDEPPAHLTLTHGTEVHWQGFGITIPCTFKIPWAAKRQEQESQGQKCRATLKSQSSIWQNSSIPNSTARLLPKPRRFKKELLQIRVLAHIPCWSFRCSECTNRLCSLLLVKCCCFELDKRRLRTNIISTVQIQRPSLLLRKTKNIS